MINECENCIMSNCCEEFENSECSEIQKYGKHIKSKIIKDFTEELKSNWIFSGKDGKPYRDTIDEIAIKFIERS